MALSLIIKRVFNFSDDRIILAGPVEGDASLIRPGRCGLHRGDALMREIEVEGEMLPKTSHVALTDRAVSIAGQLGLASGEPPERLTLAFLG